MENKTLVSASVQSPRASPRSLDGGGAGERAGGQQRAARPTRPLTHVAPRPARSATGGAARSASRLVHSGPRPVPRNYHRPTAGLRGGWCPRWPAGGRAAQRAAAERGGRPPVRGGGGSSRGAATARPSLCRSSLRPPPRSNSSPRIFGARVKERV